MDYPGIPYTQLPHVSRLFTDYLYHYPRVREFYPLNPFQEESFSQAARSLQYSDALRREMDAGFGQLRQEMDFLRSELRGEFKSGLAETRAELLKWMFVYWVGSAATTVGLILTVISVLRS